MRYLDEAGRVRQQQTFTCGGCGADATPNIEFRDGRDAPPRDLEVHCRVCKKLVAVVNPTTAAALSVPPGAAPDAADQATADANRAELERGEADAADDMNLEAQVRESQRPSGTA